MNLAQFHIYTHLNRFLSDPNGFQPLGEDAIKDAIPQELAVARINEVCQMQDSTSAEGLLISRIRRVNGLKLGFSDLVQKANGSFQNQLSIIQKDLSKLDIFDLTISSILAQKDFKSIKSDDDFSKSLVICFINVVVKSYETAGDFEKVFFNSLLTIINNKQESRSEFERLLAQVHDSSNELMVGAREKVKRAYLQVVAYGDLEKSLKTGMRMPFYLEQYQRQGLDPFRILSSHLYFLNQIENATEKKEKVNQLVNLFLSVDLYRKENSASRTKLLMFIEKRCGLGCLDLMRIIKDFQFDLNYPCDLSQIRKYVDAERISFQNYLICRILEDWQNSKVEEREALSSLVYLYHSNSSVVNFLNSLIAQHVTKIERNKYYDCMDSYFILISCHKLLSETPFFSQIDFKNFLSEFPGRWLPSISEMIRETLGAKDFLLERFPIVILKALRQLYPKELHFRVRGQVVKMLENEKKIETTYLTCGIEGLLLLNQFDFPFNDHQKMEIQFLSDKYLEELLHCFHSVLKKGGEFSLINIKQAQTFFSLIVSLNIKEYHLNLVKEILELDSRKSILEKYPEIRKALMKLSEFTEVFFV